MSNVREHYTLWVCTNCILHHANGECGCCHDDCNHEGHEPLSLVDYTKSAMGLGTEEHSEDCEVRIRGEWPDSYECDCETNTYSTSSCDGCGSPYHGERHAMTEWSE
jgi:hypothetical protein